MQPTLCSRCKKNVAVVFISRMNEKNEMVNEGLCLKCAAQLGLPQVEDMMKRMGITPEDLENINNEMMQAFGGAEEMNDLPDGEDEDDEESGKTATFPFLNRLFNNGNPPAEQPRENGNAGAQPTGRKKEQKRKFLDNYCINLSQRARDGKLDAVIGREQEIERVVQILNRRQKNNPCLIGEPGVGKTAIAEGLAQRIVSGDVPFKLRQKEVYLLDLTALVAGTQFRGQFESRMKGLIEEIRKAGNIILVIDEVHNIVGAGDAEGSMNAANILKPALSRGEIQVIGATTFTEYRKFIEKDQALERRNGAAEHKIRFNRVTDCLMGEYARKVRVHNNISVACVGVYTLCFFHQAFIEKIYSAEKLVGGGENLRKEAAPAEDLIQLDICAVLCLCGQKNIDKASGHERI